MELDPPDGECRCGGKLTPWEAMKPIRHPDDGRWVVMTRRLCPGCGGGEVLSAPVEEGWQRVLDEEYRPRYR